MELTNVYEDAKRAEAYAKLEFPDTYCCVQEEAYTDCDSIRLTTFPYFS
jgi:hypothetical protein